MNSLSLVLVAATAALMALCTVNLSAGEKPDANSVLWLESDKVHSQWNGGDLKRVVDEESKTPCLEWFQDPVLRGKAELTLTGVDPSRYDALCLEWKHSGGGSDLTVQAGNRRWFVYKDRYQPDVWREAWLDLNLDDDLKGPLLNDKGELVISLNFANLPLNRPDEKTWRRIRVKNIRLVKFPVRLTCDPKQVASTADEKSLHTIFPLSLKNTTDEARSVQLSINTAGLKDFTAALETERLELKPGEQRTVELSFTIPREKAANHPPLYYETAPVYADVDGIPGSRTTWFRGYIQWLPGGVVPPSLSKRPFMIRPGTKERILDAAKAYPWAKEILDGWVKEADKILAEAWVVPEIRHGYPANQVCPEHRSQLKFDHKDFKRHFCEKGNHYLEGKEWLDKEAAIHVHTQNSNRCRQLGWAYYLTGDERYAKKAAELLLAYADRFPKWEYADARSTGYCSRIGHAVLGEAWWSHGIIQAYDFVAASPSLSDADRKKIETDLFLIEADDIQTHRVMTNMQCEFNSSSGESAINAGNWFMAARAFTGPYGLLDQVDMTFSEDGFSLENDIAYHSAALLPLQEQGQVYEAIGGKFFTPRVKRIYDALLMSSVSPEGGNPGFFEVAYEYFRDPAYLPILVRSRGKGGTPAALIDGVIPLPEGSANGQLSSATLEMAGRSVLRKGTVDNLRGVRIFWGSPTWRGGKDMLNYITYFKGAELNTSVTRVSYGNPKAHDAFSYSTFGGNVPVVDDTGQSGIRPRQVVFRDGEFPMAKYAAPAEASPYPGVSISRSIAIVGDAFVIADRLSADRPRQLSFIFYPGVMELASTPALPFAPCDAFAADSGISAKIRSLQRASCGKAFTLDYKSGAFTTRAHFLVDGDSELVRGVTYTGWDPYDTTFLMLRRQAKTAACVIVLEAGKDPAAMPLKEVKLLPLTADCKPVSEEQGVAVSITLDSETYTLIDCDLPGVKKAGSVSTEDILFVGKDKY